MTSERTARPDTALDRWEQEALDHVWVHASHWVELAERRGLRVFVEGEGCTLVDSHGDRYLDGLSGLWVVNAGHGRAEIAEAMAKQAARLAYVSAGAFATTPAVELAEVLAQITPGDLSRVFFCSGGSEAVESAVKIAKQAQALRGFPRRYKIIARRGSYHGATFGAMSVAGLRREQEPHFGPFMYGVTHIPSPNRYRNDFGLEGEEGDLMCARFLEQEIEFQGPETVAAFIGEPVSTSNGCHVPAPRYWQMIREICDRYGVLLIMDEVINGFGRTGKMFAAEHFGVVPDILTVAKGLSSGYAPIAAAIVRPGVFEPFQPEGRRLGHLLTFGGQAVACAAALENIEILRRERLAERAAEMGAYLLEGLRTLTHHPTVGDVRGIGLMCGIELVKDKGTKERWERDGEFLTYLGEKILERRLIVRAWQVLHVAPPLVVTKAEIDRMVSILDESLTLAERKAGLIS